MALQDVLLSAGSASAVWEDPVLRAFAKVALPQFRERCGKTRINGKSFTGRFSFCIASFAVYNSSSNEDRQIVPQLRSPHCRPMISLARRPRHAATRTMVWYGSASCAKRRRISPRVNTRGMHLRPPRCRTRSMGLRSVNSHRRA